MGSLALSFNDVNFSPVERDGQIWLTASELAKALGYKKSDAVTQIYERNKDEFNSNMTLTLNLSVKGFGNGNSVKEVRIFNTRGCHAIGFFAKTAIAKLFRKWVLDVLDREVGAPAAKTHKSERTALHEAHALLVTKTKHLNVNEAWKLIHQRFNVDHIEDIPYDAIPVAVEYVHHLIALYSNADKRTANQSDYLQLIKDLIDSVLLQNCMTSCLYRAAYAFDNREGMEMANYAFKTNIAVLKLTRAMDLRGPQNRKIISDDLKTASFTEGNQHYGSVWFHPLSDSGKLAGALQFSRKN